MGRRAGVVRIGAGAIPAGVVAARAARKVLLDLPSVELRSAAPKRRVPPVVVDAAGFIAAALTNDEFVV